jgi:predicted phage gp36 major capsid-like protein
MQVNSDVQGATNRELWSAYVAVIPDENQAISGKRVGRDQTWFSRRQTEYDEGEEPKLKPKDQRALVRATKELAAEGPVGRARREAYLQAAKDAQEMADRYRALATSPPSDGGHHGVALKEVAKEAERRRPRRARGDG